MRDTSLWSLPAAVIFLTLLVYVRGQTSCESVLAGLESRLFEVQCTNNAQNETTIGIAASGALALEDLANLTETNPFLSSKIKHLFLSNYKPGDPPTPEPERSPRLTDWEELLVQVGFKSRPPDPISPQAAAIRRILDNLHGQIDSLVQVTGYPQGSWKDLTSIPKAVLSYDYGNLTSLIIAPHAGRLQSSDLPFYPSLRHLHLVGMNEDPNLLPILFLNFPKLERVRLSELASLHYLATSIRDAINGKRIPFHHQISTSNPKDSGWRLDHLKKYIGIPKGVEQISIQPSKYPTRYFCGNGWLPPITFDKAMEVLGNITDGRVLLLPPSHYDNYQRYWYNAVKNEWKDGFDEDSVV